VASSEAPVQRFSEDVKEGKMAALQFSPFDRQLASMQNLLQKYVAALKKTLP